MLLGFATTKQFQMHAGLKVDGVAGPATRAAIHAELLKRPLVTFGNARPTPKPVPVVDTIPATGRSSPPTMTLIALVVFVALLAVAIISKG